MQDGIKIKGKATLVLKDEYGKIKQVETAENLMVSAGLCFIAESLINTATTWVMSGMGVGTGTTGPADADLNLETSAAYVALDSATRALKVLTYVATFDPGVGTGALTEAVICCAASAYTDKAVGHILNRLTYSVINKAAADTLEVTWTVTFADA